MATHALAPLIALASRRSAVLHQQRSLVRHVPQQRNNLLFAALRRKGWLMAAAYMYPNAVVAVNNCSCTFAHGVSLTRWPSPLGCDYGAGARDRHPTLHVFGLAGMTRASLGLIDKRVLKCAAALNPVTQPYRQCTLRTTPFLDGIRPSTATATPSRSGRLLLARFVPGSNPQW